MGMLTLFTLATRMAEPRPSILPLLAPGVILAAIALPLLIRGWRGRIVSDHPFCRRCGFDLFGLTQPSVCPECGSPLRRHKAVRNGERRRRWKPLIAGLLLLTAGLSWSGLGIANRVRAINLNRHKPTWWLIAVETRLGPLTAGRAVNYLLERNLNDSQLTALAQRGLEIQADPKQPWQPGWGNMIERARANQLLSDQDWQHYLQNYGSFNLSIRPHIRPGQRIPIQMEFLKNRRPLSNPLVVCTCQSFTIGETSVLGEDPVQVDADSRSTLLLGALPTNFVQTEQTLPYASTWKIEYDVRVGQGTAKASRIVQLGGVCTVVAPDQTVVAPRTGRQIDEQVRSSLVLSVLNSRTMLSYEDIWGAWSGPNGSTSEEHKDSLPDIAIHLEVASLPVPLAFEILEEKDRQRRNVGTVICREQEPNSEVLPRSSTKPPFRIVLRPSAKLAEETLDLDSYYAGPEIIFECAAMPATEPIMVQPQPATTTQPAASQPVAP